MRIGAHESVAGGMYRAYERAAADGAEAMQVFVKNQNRWTAKPYTPADLAAWHERRAAAPDLPVLCHDSYLINLCAPDEANRAKSLEAFVDELTRCGQLGIRWLVLHPGSHLGTGEDEGLRAIAASLDRCLEAAKGADDVQVVLEHTAGQGTNLGHRFAHLRDIVGHSRYPQRIAVCLDTCHLYAAGYDWTTEEGYAAVFAELDEVVGLGRLAAFHLNDSKREVGSRVDRHARLGEGRIGVEPFRRLVNDPRFADTPATLETPPLDDGTESFADGIAKLKALRA